LWQLAATSAEQLQQCISIPYVLVSVAVNKPAFMQSKLIAASYFSQSRLGSASSFSMIDGRLQWLL
jgi:hypothetical protein